ncbi:MAG TPA: TonB-dependent receptor [Candidatus Dormibacteraeota bacterium]|nr:TonB-dependent receptor [Candidatus Dormibacteraeota bacterium]
MGHGKLAKIFAVLIVIVFSLSLAVEMKAQVTEATLSGTASDESGGVIPGAQISIRNTATGISREVLADSVGYYTVPNLAPGTYEVKVTAKGFNTAVSTVTLAVGAQQQLNIPMKVGETSQTIQVTTAAPQIDLTTSTLIGQVESQTILELPLNGRDWTSLATLQPGVNLIEAQMDYAGTARGNRGFGAELTISGQRTTNNNYRLDGISVNDYANSGPGNVIGASLGVDAILEFSVLTGGFSAEYGKATGGVVNAITKSGTNSFHGDAYEFIRNSALDSRDYFSRTANIPLAQFRRNQFGAAAGGPIIKDKTFIFGDYEGFRQAKGITTSITVPSDTARAGTLHYTAGTQPPSGCTPTVPETGVCTVTVDPAAAAQLAMFPHANSGTSPGSDKGKFINSALQIVPENFYTTRVDHKLSLNDSLFGMYLFDDTDFTQPDSFNNVLLKSHTRRQTVVLGESHTFGSSVVNSARIGFSRSHALNLVPAGAINPAANDLSLGSMPGQTAPMMAISGFKRNQGGVGSAPNFEHTFNNYQFADDVLWQHGTHSLKFGANIERMQYNFIARENPGGRWNFKNLAAFLTNNAKHFEAGIPSTITPRELRQTLIAGYVQDDWRFRSNLTLNLGLRYEMTTVINDAQGKITNLVNITDSAPQCGVLFNSNFAPGGKPIPGSACGSVGPYYHNPTLRNFAPRIGFAWDPFRDGKTSVRGGFGIYDVLPLPAYFLVLQNQSAPFIIFDSLDKGLKGKFYSGGQDLLTNPPPGSKLGRLATSTIETNPHRNYVLQWNLNVQRQITSDLSVSLGYVGSHGVHMLIRGDDGNMTIPTRTSAGLLFPCGPPVPDYGGPCTPGNMPIPPTGQTEASAQLNQSLGIIRYLYWGTDSSYHAMNLALDKRLSHGLQFQVAYTWSKSIDTNSSTIAGDTFLNSLNSPFWFAPKSLRGLSDFNVAHSATVNALWALPTPKSNELLKAALGGWQLGGVFKINTGIPTTVIINGDPMGLANGGADQFGIPNRVPGCDPVNHNYIGGSSPSYINVNCYALPTVSASSPLAAQCATFSGAPAPPAGQVYCANLPGNAGRNTVIGPKLVNVDLSAIKNIPIHRISETFNAQFRVEIFNIFNHSNFVPPEPIDGAGIFDETGATITNGFMSNLVTQPRDVQFALKVIW